MMYSSPTTDCQYLYISQNQAKVSIMAPKDPKPILSSTDSSLVSEVREIGFIGYTDDFSPIGVFIQKSGLTKTIAFLEQRCNNSEINLFTKCAQGLASALEVMTFVLSDTNPEPLAQQIANKQILIEEREKITEFYMELCLHLKFVYKVFALRKPLAVNAMIRILQTLVEFRNTKVLNEFVDVFEFSNQTVHKLFIPTKDDFERKIIDAESMRCKFMEFWLSLCSHSKSALRKDLLSNFKMMSGFWKYLEMDRFEILTQVFKFLLRKVLNEPMFLRSTRAKILNENFLFNVRPLFDYVKAENDRYLDNDDVGEFDSFKSAFTDFMDTLVTDQEKGISFPVNEFGTPLVVNNVTFKINNRLLYVLLTTLKPWESYLQLQFTMKILNNNSELLPPYMNWIVSSSGGYHDPSLSSYWIGHTLLYSEILKSTQLPLKTEYIALFPLSGTIQSSILKFPNDLVQQLGLQLILLQLKKLASPGIAQGVIESVLNTLPPHSSLVPFLLNKNKFLKITATQILSSWEHVAPGLSSSAIVTLIGKKLSEFDFSAQSFSGMELVLLDHYLLIQSNNDLKWWNKSGSDNSFFTSLLKLSHLPALRFKILKILQRLTGTSLAFSRDSNVEDPLLVLLESMPTSMNDTSAKKLYNCIDETIARTIKTPYKYLDKSTDLYSKLSIFVVVLFEQLKYIPDFDQEAKIHDWLNTFLRGLVIVGEPIDGITNAANDSDISIKISLKNLNLKSRLITKMDFAETMIIFNRMADSAKNENSLLDAASKMGQFLSSASVEDVALLSYTTSCATWKFLECLLSPKLKQSQVVASCLLSELLEQWVPHGQCTEIGKYIYEVSQKNLPTKNQSIVSKFLFLLSNEQILDLTNGFANDTLIVKVFQEVIKRNLVVTPNYKALLEIGSSEISDIIRAIPPRKEEIDVIIENPQFSYLFEDADNETVDYLLTKPALDDRILYQVAACSRKIAEKYQNEIVRLALSFENWPLSLKIATANPDFFNWDDIVALVENHIKDKPKDSMTREFVDILSVALATNQNISSLFLRWLNRAMLYITKKFAESSTLSSAFNSFVTSLAALFESHQIASQILSVDIVTAQLEVILSHSSWVANEVYLAYVNKLLLSIKSKQIDSGKLLQVFLTNNKMSLQSFPSIELASVRFESALVAHSLFNANASANSTLALLENVIILYQGSSRSEDLLLKDILIAIENKISKSWISLITGWAFLSDLSREEAELVGAERLIIKDNSSLVVALQKNFVNNTINSYFEVPKVPTSTHYIDFKSFATKCNSPSFFDTCYDPEFLLLVIASNEELFLFSGGQLTVDLPQLVESELLRFVVTSLCNPSTRQISKIILHGVLKFLQAQEETYRDKKIFTIYISSILHTLRMADHLTPLVWYIVGCFSSILANPAHNMYELLYQYIASHPVFKKYELPLFSSIAAGIHGNDEVEGKEYFKQAHWLIDELRRGISSPEDLKVLRFNGVLEWAMDLCFCEYISGALRNKVMHLIYSVQTIGAEGTNMLVTNNAILTSLNGLKTCINGDSLLDDQLRLNIDQVALRFAIAGSQKRLTDWTQGDIAQAAKRIKLA